MTDFSQLPPECDALCEWRTCLHKGENRGTFSVGRGYTSYYEKPVYVCMYRQHHGCGNNRIDLSLLNTKEMLKDIEFKIQELKMTNKARGYMNRLKNLIELLAEIIRSNQHE